MKKRMDEIWCIHAFEHYTATRKTPATCSMNDESTGMNLQIECRAKEARHKKYIVCDSTYIFYTPFFSSSQLYAFLKRETPIFWS